MALMEYREEALLDATDRLVYKLVRVEEDGTIVPASEDEVMEVESLMDGSSPVHATDALENQSQQRISCSLSEPVNLASNRKSSVDIPKAKSLGLAKEDKHRLVAQLAFLDAFLLKLDEKQLKGASEDYHKQGQLSSYKCKSILLTNINSEVCRELESPSSSNMDSLLSHSHGNFHEGKPGHSNSIMRLPEVNLQKGNVSLDRLSIGDLHEPYRATLVEPEVMKNKLWLKGRTAIGTLETRDRNTGNTNSVIVCGETMCDSARVSISPPAETVGMGMTQVDTNSLPDTGFSLEVGSESIVIKKGFKRKSSESAVSDEVPEHKRSNKDSTASDDGQGNSMLIDADAVTGSASAPLSPTVGTFSVKTIETDKNRLPDTELSLELGSKTTRKKKSYKRNLSKSAVSHKHPKHKRKRQDHTGSNNADGKTVLIRAKKTSKTSAAKTQSGTSKLSETVYSLKVDQKMALPSKGSKRSSDSVESVVSHEHLEHKKSSQVVTSEYSGSMGKPGEMLSSENDGKRKRKPTRRYIEELAVRGVTYTGLVSSALKDADVEINGTSILVEDEGVESAVDNTDIPEIKLHYSYRRHRRPIQEQPRKNRKNTTSSARSAQLVRKAITGRAARLTVKSTHTRIKIKPPRPDQKMDATSMSSPLQQNMETVEIVSKSTEGNSSENRAVGVKNPKSRKPDHPWTAKEVTKLLEGITHCGVGKWVEIKKFSFPNAADRSWTEVKGKWRNLVRASNRHYKLNLQRGEDRRKHLGSHIPGAILDQVHELFVAYRRGRRSNNGQKKSRRKASGR